MPVILIVVRGDGSEAYWMDVRQHIRSNPRLVEDGSFVLRPPPSRRFDAASLRGEIRVLAQRYEFGDAVAAMIHPDASIRVSSLSSLYPYHLERRAVFCLAAALRSENDLQVLQGHCDFYSRYFPHPEMTFAPDSHLREYARSLVSDIPGQQLLNLLAAFNDTEEYGDWSGATEIHSMAEEEIWDRHAIIHRGTVQQGIAEIVRLAASPDRLLSVITDEAVPLGLRRAAVALFGYLGYTCPTGSLDEIMHGTSDAPLRALLTWLRYWLKEEASGE